MGRPPPKWFADLAELSPDRFYTTPSIARRVKRTMANVRIVLNRRITPEYRSVNGEVFACWHGADLVALGEKYRQEAGARQKNQARAPTEREQRAGDDDHPA